MLTELTHDALQDQFENVPAVTGTSQGVLPDVYRDAPEVALRMAPDVPVFCFSRNALARQVKRFQDGFPGTVTYAVKANPSPEIIGALTTLGMTTFDVASPVEMELVREFCPRAILHYHNPIKSRSEIERPIAPLACATSRSMTKLKLKRSQILSAPVRMSNW